ncbi:MAG TPA: CHAT domain-containing protein [Dokdonella sp.]|uniref:CHAT domain-containing tetratricopeptide repeat protein n=1 Tax=Dokdonella sp. TaxID=2291710 RepID=UPI002BFFED91|nr:CHAT domain-containing protein [Dokdonella sp.]HUD43036.1 CHAT domain-containing protein [Dokdonella sp.]
MAEPSPAEAIRVQVSPGNVVVLPLDVPAHASIEIGLDQSEGAVEAQLTAPARDPIRLRNDAGLRSRIDYVLDAGDRATQWTLTVSSTRPDRPATVEVMTSRPQPTTTRLTARAQALQRLAEAEALRRTAGSQEAGTAKDDVAVEAAYERALIAAAADDCLQLRVETGRARHHFAQGRYREAQQAAETALASHCVDGLAGDAERAAALRTRGAARGYRGDFTGAIADQTDALALYRRTGDLAYQALLLGNLSANHRALGDTERALRTANEALATAERAGDARRAVFVQESIAAIRLQRGELGPALSAYRLTLDALRTTPYPRVEGMAWNDLGLLYRQTGDRTAARDALGRAASIWRESGDVSGLAEVQLNLADLDLDEGRLDAAWQGYRAALDVDLAQGFRREEAHARIGLGSVAALRGEDAEAGGHLEAAAVLAESIGASANAVAARLALAELALRRGDHEAAARAAATALDQAKRAHDVSGEAQVLILRARLALAAGDLAAAHIAVMPALDLIEGTRGVIDPPQLRSRYFATRRDAYDLAIEILMQRHAAQPDAGHAMQALLVSERARARALQDRLNERRLTLPDTVDLGLLEAERTAELAVRAAAAEDDAAVAEAQRRLDAVRGQIRAQNPRYAELAHPPAPTSDAILQLLHDRGIVADSWWLAEPHSYRWRITAGGVSAAVLPGRTAIETAALRLRERVAAAPAAATAQSIERIAIDEAARAAEVDAAAHALTTLLDLPDAADDALHVTIPDGALAWVPFVLLEPDAGRGRVYLPALSALTGIRAAARSGAPDAVAIVADPVVRADDPRLPQTGVPAIDAPTPLPYARREARALLALADRGASRWIDGFDASRQTLAALPWARYGTVHFATHARLDVVRPDLSAIVLSAYAADGTPQDGVLRADDLYTLDMPVDLVVLGACDGAIGPIQGAEGPFSLARAFFHAGARRVLASLWAVDDRAGAALMGHFYEGLLRQGLLPPQALARAQRALRAEPRWAAPYYWAGYVLQGDWR